MAPVKSGTSRPVVVDNTPKIAGPAAPKLKRRRKVFLPLEQFNPVDDPLKDLPDTGSVQENAKQELKAIKSAFKRQVDHEKRNISHRFDTEYWFAVCFQDRDQKNAFLAALDLLKSGDKYIDGRVLAHRLGIALPESEMRYDWNNNYNKTDRF